MAGRHQQDVRYPWRRHWIALDDKGGVAVRGLFSTDLHAMTANSVGKPARALAAMDDVRVLLLRGESGAGKSVALSQEADRLRSAGRPCEVADLADDLRDLPDLLTQRGGETDLTIVVDGLDVGLVRNGSLMRELRRAISNLAGREGVRLRLALRSGFSADALTDALQTAFGEDFEQLTLAPLRAEDVATAAHAENLEPEPFLRALEGLRLTPLAARPPTLRMLLRLWAQNGCLPNRREEVYRMGCEVLVREANSIRLNANGGDKPEFVGHLTTSERLAIAARIAALMAFSGHDHLDMSADAASGLFVEDILGGEEPTGSASVRVTRTTVREVVGSALFRAFGRSGFAFAHPSLMRFLAARFVTARDLSPRQSLPLLTAPDGRVGANGIEVASWLGALDPTYFEHLTITDPQVLLRAGIPSASADQRLLLAKALLAASAGGTLDLNELEATGDLVVVSAPGVTELVREVLEDKAQPLSRRSFAALLARDTGSVPIAACAAIAGDDGEPDTLRSAAIAALATNPAAAADAILGLCDAADAEIGRTALGIALGPLLSPAEAIVRLKPGPQDLLQIALILKLCRQITPASVPDGLKAIAHIAMKNDSVGDRDDLRTIAQALSNRAFAHLDDEQIFDGLAEFIAKLPCEEPWLRWSFPFHKRGLPPETTETQRLALVSRVVGVAEDETVAARNLLEGCFVLQNEDLSWLVRTAAGAVCGPHERLWATLALEVARSCGGSPYTRLLAEGLTPPVAQQIVAAGLEMAPDFERWTAPAWWDPISRARIVEDEDGVDEESDSDQEPLGKALDDWRLLTIQREAGGRHTAPPVAVHTVLSLAKRPDRRLVRDDSDLLRVVQESLERLQQRLKGKGALARALWDEGEKTKPKEENFLSDFIVDHLRSDLGEADVIADREVEIRPRQGATAGQRTDIWVRVFTTPQSTGGRCRIAGLTIEVKGCWNSDLHTAMEAQLLDRYLTTTEEKVGLYLVGWYVCPIWSEPKLAGLQSTTSGATIGALRSSLEAQALSLAVRAHIAALVLDATLS